VSDFSVSRDGSLVYLNAGETPGRGCNFEWVHRAGRKDPLNLSPGRYNSPRLPGLTHSTRSELRHHTIEHVGFIKLACYLMRSPVKLSRLRYHPGSQLILYEPKAGHAVDGETRLHPFEFCGVGRPSKKPRNI
jgi:hypothetical protein